MAQRRRPDERLVGSCVLACLLLVAASHQMHKLFETVTTLGMRTRCLSRLLQQLHRRTTRVTMPGSAGSPSRLAEPPRCSDAT